MYVIDSAVQALAAEVPGRNEGGTARGVCIIQHQTYSKEARKYYIRFPTFKQARNFAQV